MERNCGGCEGDGHCCVDEEVEQVVVKQKGNIFLSFWMRFFEEKWTVGFGDLAICALSSLVWMGIALVINCVVFMWLLWNKTLFMNDL